jgi:hypothetical protein
MAVRIVHYKTVWVLDGNAGVCHRDGVQSSIIVFPIFIPAQETRLKECQTITSEGSFQEMHFAFRAEDSPVSFVRQRCILRVPPHTHLEDSQKEHGVHSKNT